MNQEIKRRWVEALRSGGYRQGTSELRTPDKILGDRFCCLGVLCEIAIADGVVQYDQDENQYVAVDDKQDKSDIRLLSAVLRWAGLPLADPEVKVGPEGEHLSTLNDSGRYDFHQIADMIERKL